MAIRSTERERLERERPDVVRMTRAYALGVGILLAASSLLAAYQGASLGAERLTIQIEDVALFYRIYDAAGRRPGAEQLQREYIDAGSDGLRTFARLRNTTGARIAEAISTRPEIYEDGRRCADVLPRVRHRLDAALGKLAAVYPEARFPPVTIAVGRGRPVAVGGRSTGVQIGLEALCATNFLNPNVEDRFVYVIAHEFAHVQQTAEPADFETLTVLDASLMEGAAEFIAELTAGSVAYSHLSEAVVGRELEIETAFAAEMHGTDLSNWLYNTTAEATGDLGYWVGYRIVKAYYQRAREKRRAVREILQMTDRRAFLAASGWRPGLRLESTTLAAAPQTSSRDALAKPFAYDASRPIDGNVTPLDERDGVTTYEVLFPSPRGGMVTGYLVVPSGDGPFAGLVFGHWGLGTGTEFLPEATL